MPTNILNLPLLVVDPVSEDDHDYHVKAHASCDPAVCPECKHTGLPYAWPDRYETNWTARCTPRYRISAHGLQRRCT